MDGEHVRYLEEAGTWCQRIGERPFAGAPALFLDRDGVIVEEVNYLHRREDMRLIPGIADAIAAANQAGIPVIVVTNQSGIARGYFEWQQFAAIQATILEALAEGGAAVDLVLACGYHGDGQAPYRIAEHAWRKPNPGMLLHAQKLIGVDLASSYLVGDTITDLQAAQRAGLPGGALALTGHGALHADRHSGALEALKRDGFAVTVADDPASAVRQWLDRHGRQIDRAIM